MNPTSYQIDQYCQYRGITRASYDALVNLGSNPTDKEVALAAAFLAAVMLWLNCAGIPQTDQSDPSHGI